jgi:DNA-binding response OmpR family regulator
MKILVIDDDACLARALQRMLRSHDVSVETDSPSALAEFASAESEGDPFDLVLCDWKMAGMNGIELATAVRSHRNPPMVVLMSGDDEIATLNCADAFLIKPFCAADVQRAIVAIRDARAAAKTQRMRVLSRDPVALEA